MRCIICDSEKDGSKEHIIPEAMGNSKFFTSKFVITFFTYFISN